MRDPPSSIGRGGAGGKANPAVSRSLLNRVPSAGGWARLGFLLVLACQLQTGQALDIVRDGKPVATILIEQSALPLSVRRQRTKATGDLLAAQVLADWIRKMTGAEMPIAALAVENAPAIYVGAAAIKAGLRLDDLASPSREGLRIRSEGARLLVAGQSETATLKAVCRLLEHWGCRYFVDHLLGEVFPRTNTLVVGALDVTEQPGFLSRRIWGSGWSGDSLWKIWNGAGGVPFSTAHAWGHYVPKSLFADHPEYFRLRNGAREAGDWYCTSNPKLREVFTQGVLARIRARELHPSISPPDGRGYCECAECRAQDDPSLFEPSSGHLSVSTRYVDFYQHVARQVAAVSPDSILNFYCYADYTQPPRRGVKLESNLCAWIAPIRYCRFHAIGQAGCPSRVQLQELVDGWASSSSKIAYRTYNFNLAEALVPFSMISVWQHDIPYLKQKGCLGLNLETLANWQIYGPHIYLSIRLAYDPSANVHALMDDYFLKFYGAQAGPSMKEYWLAIDRAFAELKSHAGGFAAVHLVYTPEFLKRCRILLNDASAAARGDETCAARVRMTDDGLRNAEQYAAVLEAMNQGDFRQAQHIYADLLARNEGSQSSLGNHYTVNYLKRFIGPAVTSGREATASPRQLAQVLPDTWRMTYDEADAGKEKGFHQVTFDDRAWPRVATFSKPLDAQGFPDRQTILWYRTVVEGGQTLRKPTLLFLEVDGDAAVYVNGQFVGVSEKKRRPFAVDIAGVWKQGKNLIAVRVDHRSMTELFLGGIIRPVLLID